MSEDANELQQNDDIVLPGQLDKSNTVEPASDSSTDSGDNHEQKTNGVQERINKITADKYSEQRRADDLERQLNDLKSQTPKPEIKSDLVAPSLPEDIYDEDAMRKYYADSAKYNQEVATQAATSTYERQQQERAAKKQETKRNETVNKYVNNAQRDGVDLEKLRVAEQTVSKANISNDLAAYIMNDNNGGKIVEYLHDNPAALHELASLDPISAGMKIANEIKPAVLSTTPKVSNAPTPPTEIRGGGVHEQDEFEKNYPGATFI